VKTSAAHGDAECDSAVPVEAKMTGSDSASAQWFLLQRLQPAMTGLIDGLLSTWLRSLLSPSQSTNHTMRSSALCVLRPDHDADGESSDDLGGVLERPSGQAGGN
jgi:hypothetical protein